MVDESRDPTRSRSSGYDAPAAPKDQSKPDFFQKAPRKPPAESKYAAPGSANAYAGGTENTAGGKTKQLPSFTQALTSLKLEQIAELPKQVCVREGLMIGMVGGFVGYGVRLVAGGSIWAAAKAANWAAGSFVVISLGAYENCRRRRLQAKRNMEMVREASEQRRGERQREKERLILEEARIKREDEEVRQKQKRWYNFW
ncbi:MAG: hypothetical protein M1814_005742 [Vezdaea aestivalis]|nr:MAG: hypothetical protein M1814_005742 [Vezdaea aestivalis]